MELLHLVSIMYIWEAFIYLKCLLSQRSMREL